MAHLPGLTELINLSQTSSHRVRSPTSLGLDLLSLLIRSMITVITAGCPLWPVFLLNMPSGQTLDLVSQALHPCSRSH